MSKSIIKVENLSKKYKIGTYSASLRETLAQKFSKMAVPKEQSEFWALRDISFEVKEGEALGIIGKNGAGKSTLLKVLSSITHPTTGNIEINGRISTLLEVGTGFHPELTGRENIFLNGSILGMKRHEIRSKFDEIVDFSGVEKFIDTPVKRYSSGMYVRLAFSVAAHLEPEILIVDEVLAVGDAEFQKKCLGKMDGVAKNGRTVIFVSHNMGAVQNLCTSGLLMQHGQLVMSGDIKQVISKYTSKNKSAEVKDLSKVKRSYDWGKSIQITDCFVQNIDKQRVKSLLFNEPIVVVSSIKAIEKSFENLNVIVSIETDLGTTVFGVESKSNSKLFACKHGEEIVIKTFVNGIKLTPGEYSLKIAVKHEGLLLDLVRQEVFFTVQDLFLENTTPYSGLYGLIDVKSKWEEI